MDAPDILSFLFVFLLAYCMGCYQNRRVRRHRRAVLARKLQLIAVRNEMLGYRRKGRRPVLPRWRKALLALLHAFSPTLTRYSCFRPETLVRWHRRFVRQWWHLISLRGRRKVGRPGLDDSVAQVILDIKAANPRYGAKRIAAILGKQLGIPVSATTVRNVLARHRRSPSPPASGPGQKWRNFLDNHREVLAAMDFKVTFDWRAKPLFILSILDHARRKLIACQATYHPSAAWVAQQLREAFPFDEGPKLMLMDNDRIFLPIARQTLPNMGVQVIRIGIACPKQNAIIERFNRTLTEELLDHVIPISDRHLNRLLGEFRTFYNTARPHRTLGGEAPISPTEAENDNFLDATRLRAEAIPWLGGLHHSYRRVA
jgi:transposase InsO family protein